ncbi:DUF2764 family protein [Desulfopila inferna]|nr:DUF2764 family protein [Desulfopila inferna]
MKRYFYLLCVLPGLKKIDDPPPVTQKELLAVVEKSQGPLEIVRSLLLNHDLLQRDAVIAGEIEPEQTDLVVLSLKQAKSEPPLPELPVSMREVENESGSNVSAADPVWQRYFHHVSRTAKMNHSHFLKFWVQFEVGLRNALARERATALQLDPQLYLVAPELEDGAMTFETILAEWKDASNPLQGMEVLDRARWNRLTEHERWYSFSSDELAAYTAKLMILHRWRRIAGNNHKDNR